MPRQSSRPSTLDSDAKRGKKISAHVGHRSYGANFGTVSHLAKRFRATTNCSFSEHRNRTGMPHGAKTVSNLLLAYDTRNDYSHNSLIVAPVGECVLFFFATFIPLLVVRFS